MLSHKIQLFKNINYKLCSILFFHKFTENKNIKIFNLFVDTNHPIDFYLSKLNITF